MTRMHVTPVGTGTVGGSRHATASFNARQRLRLQSRSFLATRQSQRQSTSCCFKAKRTSQTVLCSNNVKDNSHPADQPHNSLKQNLSKAAAYSWAPFAIVLPLCYGDNGNGGANGGGSGGGNGDGSGSGGQSDHSQNVVAELAADSSEEEEEEEDDDEDEDVDEEVVMLAMPTCI